MESENTSDAARHGERYIQIEHVMTTRPEVFGIARRTGLDRLAVVGRLVQLWIWADLNTVQGVVGVDPEDLNSLVDSIAEHAGFSDAMREVGWLGAEGFPRLRRTRKRARADARQCAGCDGQFVPVRPSHIYCSDKCRKQRADAKRTRTRREPDANRRSRRTTETETETETESAPSCRTSRSSRPAERDATEVIKRPEQSPAKKKRKPKKKIPPPIDEAAIYAATIGLAESDVADWYDHHQARGWRLRTGPMQDWKATLRTWKRRKREFAATNGNATAGDLDDVAAALEDAAAIAAGGHIES